MNLAENRLRWSHIHGKRHLIGNGPEARTARGGISDSTLRQ